MNRYSRLRSTQQSQGLWMSHADYPSPQIHMSIYPIACCAVLYKTHQHKVALYVNLTSWHTSRWHQLQSAVTSTMFSAFLCCKASASSCFSELHIWRTGLPGNTSWWTVRTIHFMIHCTLRVRYKTKVKHLAERVLYLPVCKTILSRKLYLQWTFFGTQLSLNPKMILAKHT